MDCIDFTITVEALDYVVEKAVEYKLVARVLRSLCEAILSDAMFEMPEGKNTKLEVTRDYAEEKLDKSGIKRLKAVS